MFQANSFLALLILCFSPFAATANQALVVDVSYDDGIYRASLSTHLNAKQSAVYSLLTAYDSLNTFSRLIYKSQLLKNGDLLINLPIVFSLSALTNS